MASKSNGQRSATFAGAFAQPSTSNAFAATSSPLPRPQRIPRRAQHRRILHPTMAPANAATHASPAMTSDPITVLPTKRLIVCAQDKGGIGKSFLTTLLYDYFRERSVRLKAFDLDHANSTFQRYVPEAEFIDTDVDANKLAVLDQLVHALRDVDVVLADNRAAGGAKVRQYLEENRLTALQTEIGFA